jgi:hypothetical protein
VLGAKPTVIPRNIASKGPIQWYFRKIGMEPAGRMPPAFDEDFEIKVVGHDMYPVELGDG